MRLTSLKLPGLRARTVGAGARRSSFATPKATTLLMVLGAIFLALLVGAVAALGAIRLTVGLMAIVLLVPAVMILNTRALLPMLLVVVFVLQGIAEYFLQMRQATWLATALCGLFFLRAIIELSGARSHAGVDNKVPSGARNVIIAAALYLLFYFFSLAIGNATFLQIVSTLRFSVPMFGVLFALYWFKWPDKSLRNAWTLILVIMVIQLPIVIYQHIFMIATLGWDGVVGSFGRGMSPVLALFSLTALLYVLSKWSRGLMGVRMVIATSLIAFAVILAGEVKAILIWLPIGVLWVLRRRVLRNVVAFIMFSSLALAFTAGTYTAYKVMYWGNEKVRDDTMSEKLDAMGSYAVDPSNMNFRTGEISRGASLALWYFDPVPNVTERLVGYGPGASANGASTGPGVVSARYLGLHLGATALARLLWDVGILGTLAYLSLFVTGILAGIRYVRRAVDQERAAIVDTCTAMLGIFFTTLVYNRNLVDEPTSQLLCFFCLGCIVHYSRHDKTGLRSIGAKPAASSVPP